MIRVIQSIWAYLKTPKGMQTATMVARGLPTLINDISNDLETWKDEKDRKIAKSKVMKIEREHNDLLWDIYNRHKSMMSKEVRQEFEAAIARKKARQ